MEFQIDWLWFTSMVASTLFVPLWEDLDECLWCNHLVVAMVMCCLMIVMRMVSMAWYIDFHYTAMMLVNRWFVQHELIAVALYRDRWYDVPNVTLYVCPMKHQHLVYWPKLVTLRWLLVWNRHGTDRPRWLGWLPNVVDASIYVNGERSIRGYRLFLIWTHFHLQLEEQSP